MRSSGPVQGNRQACHNDHTEQEEQCCDTGLSPVKMANSELGFFMEKAILKSFMVTIRGKKKGSVRNQANLSELSPHKDDF